MYRRAGRFLLLAAMLLVVAVIAPASVLASATSSSGTPTVVRYAGTNRFSTAVSISAHTFPANCACTVYVATAFNVPDALAGAAAAGTIKGPVLLAAPTGTLNYATRAEIQRLKPARIVMLGGESALSWGVRAQLLPLAPTVVRYSGSNRFSTAAAISAHTFPANCACTVYVATAFNFPDALAAAAAAGTIKGPVLLAAPTGTLNPATKAAIQRLKPAKIVMLGGEGALSWGVRAQLLPLAPIAVRYSGSNRFSTAAAISSHTFRANCACTVYIATAFNFPDALAGAAAAGTAPGPILLVSSKGRVDPSISAEIRRLAPNRIVVLGSTGVVSAEMAASVASLVPPPGGHPYSKNIFADGHTRWQDPDRTACTAAATLTMLNFVATTGSGGSGFGWAPTTSYTAQQNILAWERLHMTMVRSSAGSDPHGWRNALNFYGWASFADPAAMTYTDQSFDSYDAAAKAAVVALARYDKPVGILNRAGHHAQLINGYEVYGEDPVSSANFIILAVYLTDPLKSAAIQNARVTNEDFAYGTTSYRFQPYLETDSPYDDPYTDDAGASKNEWYGHWVIIAPVR